MTTMRVPISREMRWRVTPTALQIWKLILELQSHPRDAHGELCEADRVAERDARIALAAEMGFDKYTIEPARIDGDEPWKWITDNSVQMERWQLGKEIRDALNAALLAETGRRDTAAAHRRAKPEPQPEPKAL